MHLSGELLREKQNSAKKEESLTSQVWLLQEEAQGLSNEYRAAKEDEARAKEARWKLEDEHKKERLRSTQEMSRLGRDNKRLINENQTLMEELRRHESKEANNQVDLEKELRDMTRERDFFKDKYKIEKACVERFMGASQALPQSQAAEQPRRQPLQSFSVSAAASIYNQSKPPKSRSGNSILSTKGNGLTLKRQPPGKRRSLVADALLDAAEPPKNRYAQDSDSDSDSEPRPDLAAGLRRDLLSSDPEDAVDSIFTRLHPPKKNPGGKKRGLEHLQSSSFKESSGLVA
eukprot:CAMPEP_0182484708 /NCGR_PEP_ID=MMETSP1319-20130603/43904_1 /TAXON_ID=172717 /ORGANISM="Bolidomonas pacifica, Strain RCC208" /LENGTH=288 /DNA_ID=CAMNT_0024686625 /DNA_START=21 /DNA_END=883 /DNA_ORIENTATION=+